MGCRRHAVPSLLLLIVTIRFRIAHAWTCSISINGTPSLADSTITECSLLCRPGTGEASSGDLPVVVHPALNGCLFIGGDRSRDASLPYRRLSWYMRYQLSAQARPAHM